jgi:quercetin dioxygenase-like cupin family protein
MSNMDVKFETELIGLRREKPWAHGHSARTLVKNDGLRVVLIALEAGGRVLEHKTAGYLSIQTIAGHVRVGASGRSFDLKPGQLLALDHDEPHDVQAVEDSAVLLTIGGRAAADTGRG